MRWLTKPRRSEVAQPLLSCSGMPIASLRRNLMLSAATLPLLVGAEGDGCTPSSPTTPRDDAWSSAVELRVGPSATYATPAHASLLPDGRVLAWGAGRATPAPQNGPFGWTDIQLSFVMAPHPLGADLPAQQSYPRLTPALETPAHMAFCAGQGLTATGEVFLAGGSVFQGIGFLGLRYGQRFDGQSWSRLPAEMVGKGIDGTAARWYPSVTRLGDGRMLVLGGSEHSFPPRANNSAEVYDPALAQWRALATHAASPVELYKYDYTFTALLPSPLARDGRDYEVLAMSERFPMLFDIDSGAYSALGPPRPGTTPLALGTNVGSAAALLPFPASEGAWGYSSGSLLVIGGHDGQPANRSVDVYDPVQGRWLTVATLEVDQHHTSAVTLPDGSIVLLGGHDGPNLRALHIDPRTQFSIGVGTAQSAAQRGYHNVAVLLPDGRVLVASGSPDGQVGNERADLEYYEPPYLKRPRPVLGDVPSVLTLGQTLTIQATSRLLAEVVLIALPSVTHSFDWNGRSVQLATQVPASSLTTRLPSSASKLPPGYYMLFGLDDARTPSVARIVRVVAP